MWKRIVSKTGFLNGVLELRERHFQHCPSRCLCLLRYDTRFPKRQTGNENTDEND